MEGVLKSAIFERFRFSLDNQRRYGKMDATIEFSASNMTIYTLEVWSYGQGRVILMGKYKFMEFFIFLIIKREPMEIQ